MPFNLRWDAVQHTLGELVHFRSSDCFSCPPIPPNPPHPCPRSPSPDTASTSALVQGQQEGDTVRLCKPRLRAQLQPSSLGRRCHTLISYPSTTLREPDSHSIVAFLCASILVPIARHFSSCLITPHEYGREGGVGAALFPALAIHSHWGTLGYRPSSTSPARLAFCTKVERPTLAPRSPNLGRIPVILRVSKPRERHRPGARKRLCANAALVPRGKRTATPCRSNPNSPQGRLHPDKDSFWSTV